MMTTRDEIIAQTAEYVRQAMSAGDAAHDWWHVERVRRTAVRIGTEEGADLFVVELAALLHDVADWKLHGGDETAGPRAAREWLERLRGEPAVIAAVCDIIGRLSFKGAGVPTDMPTPEGRVVQDADRLDALGAVGIARTFAFGGAKGRPLHDPHIPPERHDSFEAYQRKTGPSVNHFYEKLLLLHGRMQTPTGRRLAEERHRFMEEFLQRFFAEWEGNA